MRIGARGETGERNVNYKIRLSKERESFPYPTKSIINVICHNIIYVHVVFKILFPTFLFPFPRIKDSRRIVEMHYSRISTVNEFK